MNIRDRLTEYSNDDFDRMILHIKNGRLRAGKYSHLVKVDENKKLKGTKFFEREDETYEDNKSE